MNNQINKTEKPHIDYIGIGDDRYYISYSDSDASVDYFHAYNIATLKELFDESILQDMGDVIKVIYQNIVNTDTIEPLHKTRLERIAKKLGYKIEYKGIQTAYLYNPKKGLLK
jgi:hypothetical protein